MCKYFRSSKFINIFHQSIISIYIYLSEFNGVSTEDGHSLSKLKEEGVSSVHRNLETETDAKNIQVSSRSLYLFRFSSIFCFNLCYRILF